MAVPEQIPFKEYTANGVTTAFPLTFDCDKAEFLIVTINGVAAPSGSWSLNLNTVNFITAPLSGKVIGLQRNTPLERTTNYQSYDNSFRPVPVNKDFDLIWWKLQELGYADSVLNKGLQDEILNRIAADNAIMAHLKAEDDALRVDYTARDVALKNYIDALVNNITGENFLPITDQFVQTWSNRTQLQKNKDIIHAKDYGLIGDGSDETAKILALLTNTGSLIVFEKNKTYGFKGTLNLYGNAILFNSAKLLNLEAHANWSVIIYANTCILDEIFLTVQNNNGMRVIESNVNINSIRVESVNESPLLGCMICPLGETDYITNIKVKSISTKNFNSHVQVYRVTKSKVDVISMTNYVVGLYFRDCQDSHFSEVYARTLMSRGLGVAGQNAILFESVLGNNSTRNVSFDVVDVEDSAEHGIRLGGVYSIDNISFGFVRTRNTGAGSAATGGGGFKILGGNRTNDFNYHTNIKIGTLVTEDCAATKGLNNFAALIISHAKHVHIGKHIVRAINKPVSARRGVHLASCEDISISSQSYNKLLGNAVLFFTNEDPAMVALDSVKNVRMLDLYSDGNESDKVTAAIYFSGTVVKVSDIHIVCHNLKYNFVAYSVNVTTGSYDNINLDVEFKALTDTTGLPPPVRLSANSGEFLVNIRGPFFGTFGSSASNGSRWTDAKNDIYYLRKAAAWRQITTS
jgi:hypothetical protein